MTERPHVGLRGAGCAGPGRAGRRPRTLGNRRTRRSALSGALGRTGCRKESLRALIRVLGTSPALLARAALLGFLVARAGGALHFLIVHRLRYTIKKWNRARP